MKFKFPKIGLKEAGLDILFYIVGSALYAAGVITFAKNANFAPGGVTGLAMIINHFFDKMPIGVCTLLINVPVIIVSFKTMGTKFFVKSIASMIITSLMIDVVFPYVPAYVSDERLLAAIFAGVFSGLGLALIYSRGSSTGGSDFLILSIRKKMPHASIGTITMVIDGSILILVGLTFKSIESVLYAVIMTLLSTFVIDKITYGMSSGKVVMIITDNGNALAEVIGRDVHRGVTMMDAKGAYTGAKKDVLMCSCSRTDVTKIKSIIRKVDKKAIVMMCPVDEAYGFGFKDIEE